MMKHTVKTTLAAAITASIASSMALASEPANTLGDALENGKVDITLRYRYENVDQDNGLDEAHASTLKSRLTYTTKTYKDFHAQVQVDDVSVIGDDNYNDTQNGRIDHSVVADPDGTEINQAWIAYTGLSDTTIKHGRQLVNLDNQRFIGGVGWRQNEQTHDATAVINTSLPDTTIVAAYVTNVNTILEGDIDTSTNLLNINYKGLGFGAISAYHYASAEIRDTTGIRLAGSADAGDIKVHYEAEYAKQSEHDSNSPDVDADYTHLVLGATVSDVTVKLGQEVLGSDDGNAAFQTALGTKHKFNGWADQFLGTPDNGLEDVYLTVSSPILGAKVSLTYHQFDADEGSAEYGDEINLAIAKKLNKDVTLLLKYADYDAEDHSVDTQKLWLQAVVNF